MKNGLLIKLLINLGVFILLLWFGYNSFVKVSYKESTELQYNLNAIEREISSTKPKDMPQKTPSEINREIDLRLSTLNSKFPREADIPYLMEDLINVTSNGLNLDYTLVQPSTIMPEGEYRKLPISVSFSSDFDSLTFYLTKLESLQIVTRVDQINIKKIEKPESSRNLDVELSMVVYVMPGGSVQKAENSNNLIKLPNTDPFYGSDANIENKLSNLDSKNSLLFTKKDFLNNKSISKLCSLISSKNYGLDLVSEDNSLARLNEILSSSGFYDSWIQQNKGISISKANKDKLLLLVKATDKLRDKSFYELSGLSKNQIIMLNKHLIEITFPGFIQHKTFGKISTKKGARAPKLKGIYTGESSKVFINNSFASIGETVDGYKIISIKNQKVVVKRGSKTYTLQLGR